MKNIVILILSTLLTFSLSADTIKDRLKSLSLDGAAFGSFLMLIIGIAGVILIFLGILGLKKYADNSQQNPLGKPMIFLVAGALMTGFSAFQALLGKSFVGESGDKATGRDKFRAGSLS